MAQKRKISKAYRRIMQCGSQVSVPAVASPKRPTRLAKIGATILHGSRLILQAIFFPFDWMDDHLIGIIMWVFLAGIILFYVFAAIFFATLFYSDGGVFGWFAALVSIIPWLWLIRKVIRD